MVMVIPVCGHGRILEILQGFKCNSDQDIFLAPTLLKHCPGVPQGVYRGSKQEYSAKGMKFPPKYKVINTIEEFQDMGTSDLQIQM